MLIEKDWVSFGHKFSHRLDFILKFTQISDVLDAIAHSKCKFTSWRFRCGHLDGEVKEVSPVIDQFLECVWQFMDQFPCSFEYNEKFLISIHNHVYSCHYGNFICNSQKERKDLW